jgi:hypothetical protein
MYCIVLFCFGLVWFPHYFHLKRTYLLSNSTPFPLSEVSFIYQTRNNFYSAFLCLKTDVGIKFASFPFPPKT